MSSFSSCISHPGELLTDHLTEVSIATIKNADGTTERIEKAALLLGLLHDVGKATSWFQDRITGKVTEKDRRSHHAQLGAVFANHILSNLEMSNEEWLKYVVVTGIAKHHVNIAENPKEAIILTKQELRNGDIFQEQMKSFIFDDFGNWLNASLKGYGYSNVLNLAETPILDSFNKISPLTDNPFKIEEDGIEYLIAWGCLLGADKLSAAMPEWHLKRHNIRSDIVSKYITKKFGSSDSEMKQLRDDVFNEIQSTLKNNMDAKFYTITAPTGSGKTLSGLAAGLMLKEAKEQNGHSRLIYCLPFTSIIDQNSAIYREVLKSVFPEVDTDILLTHHHLSDGAYKVDDEYIEDGANLLVETWQSEIVVTTFHQLLYTVFSSKNKMVKRIPALKNAVVILDEVQAIPHRYWDDIYKMFCHLSNLMGTTFVLMTATMPLIIPQEKAQEILPSYPKYYSKLSRTKINNQVNTQISLDKLTEGIKKNYHKNSTISRIIILNRRGLVRDLYDKLLTEIDNLWMLSTDFTPKDRCMILSQLTTPFTLLSTQVIEAGVDISARQVWRDIAPLDSIIQSAGRCNRNLEVNAGQVILFKLVENGKMAAVPPYDSFLIQTTIDVLNKHDPLISEEEYYNLSQEYYRLLKSRSEQSDIMRHFAKGDFHKLSGPEGLQLITDIPRQSYFIIQSDEDAEIWNKYVQLESESDLFERRRKMRSMKREFLERIVSQIDKNASDEVIPLYHDDKRYNSKTGLLPGKAGYEII